MKFGKIPINEIKKYFISCKEQFYNIIGKTTRPQAAQDHNCQPSQPVAICGLKSS